MKFKEIIKDRAEYLDIDPALVTAIISAESSFDPLAIRFEPQYPWLADPAKHAAALGVAFEYERHLQKFSYGLGQIMGATARDIGYNIDFKFLFEPEVNIYWTVKFLKRLEKRYKTTEKVIASYNAGSPRKVEGRSEWVNQSYVDKVMTRMLDYQVALAVED